MENFNMTSTVFLYNEFDRWQLCHCESFQNCVRDWHPKGGDFITVGCSEKAGNLPHQRRLVKTVKPCGKGRQFLVSSRQHFLNWPGFNSKKSKPLHIIFMPFFRGCIFLEIAFYCNWKPKNCFCNSSQCRARALALHLVSLALHLHWVSLGFHLHCTG